MRSRGEEIEEAARALLRWVEAMRVPQTTADAGLQVITGAPILDALRAALARPAEEARATEWVAVERDRVRKNKQDADADADEINFPDDGVDDPSRAIVVPLYTSPAPSGQPKGGDASCPGTVTPTPASSSNDGPGTDNPAPPSVSEEVRTLMCQWCAFTLHGQPNFDRMYAHYHAEHPGELKKIRDAGYTSIDAGWECGTSLTSAPPAPAEDVREAAVDEDAIARALGVDDKPTTAAERTEKDRPAYPSLYCAVWPDLVPVARALGYALMIHGSLSRDLDLVAVPWTEEAVHYETLIEAVRRKFGAWVGDAVAHPREGRKPHGRIGAIILLGGHAVVDLSIMPRSLPLPTGAKEREEVVEKAKAQWKAARDLFHAPPSQLAKAEGDYDWATENTQNAVAALLRAEAGGEK